jgi:hypothetical protein
MFDYALQDYDKPFDTVTTRAKITYSSIIGSKIEKNVFYVFRGTSFFGLLNANLFQPIFDYFKINIAFQQILQTYHFSQIAVQSLENLTLSGELAFSGLIIGDPFFQIIKYQNLQENVIKLLCFGGSIRGQIAVIWDMGTPENWQMPNNPACYCAVRFPSGSTGHRFVYGVEGGIVLELTSISGSSNYDSYISVGGYGIPRNANDSQIFIPESNLVGISGKLATGIITKPESVEFLADNFIGADLSQMSHQLTIGEIPPPLDTRQITLFNPSFTENGRVNPNIFYPISQKDSGKEIFT